MRRRRLLIACLAGAILLLLCAPGQADAEPVAGIPESEKISAAELAEMDGSRTARRNRPENRPRNRISRYLSAAAEKTDDGSTAEALELLDKLNPARLNMYERALVGRLRAFIAYSAGDVTGAIEAFRSVLAEEILQVKDDTRIRFNIAQLYAGEQKWPETVAALHDWFRYVEEGDGLAYYLLAVAYFQQDQFPEATVNAERAIDVSADPREGWLQLLAALYIQEEDYSSATPVLEELVLRYPKRLYWVQLSLIYGARENYRHSLAVQQVAHTQGLLEDDKELRRLARSYLYANLPYPAAQVLEKGLADGAIASDADAHELLANSWIGAREYEKSLEPLQQAASLSETGELYVRLGQVYLQREEWQTAAAMLDKAVAKGSLKKPGQALLLLGISHYNAEQVGPARSYFSRARQHEETKPQAERWLTHLNTEAQNAAGTGPSEEPT